jgi:hypothetical protein
MKITKFDILDGLTAGFGMSGALALLLGGGFCLGGLTATGIIKTGELLSHAAPAYKKAMFYGAVGSGAGLFLIGLGAATSHLRDKAGEEEMEEIAARYTAAVAAKIKPQDKQRTWAEWQEYEEIKKFCRGCQFYRGGGLCALYGESKSGCSDHSDLPSCTNCKYYSSNNDLLPCAVHPLGLRQDCSEWESVETND